jgi:hypothetical protein
MSVFGRNLTAWDWIAGVVSCGCGCLPGSAGPAGHGRLLVERPGPGHRTGKMPPSPPFLLAAGIAEKNFPNRRRVLVKVSKAPGHRAANRSLRPLGTLAPARSGQPGQKPPAGQTGAAREPRERPRPPSAPRPVRPAPRPAPPGPRPAPPGPRPAPPGPRPAQPGPRPGTPVVPSAPRLVRPAPRPGPPRVLPGPHPPRGCRGTKSHMPGRWPRAAGIAARWSG